MAGDAPVPVVPPADRPAGSWGAILGLLLVAGAVSGMWWWQRSERAAQIARTAAAQASWHTSLAAVLPAAAGSPEAGLPILVDFTGSTWCPGCIALGDEVFASKTFAQWADGRIRRVKLDYPLEPPPEPDPALLERLPLLDRFRIEMYPTVVFLDGQGRELGRMEGYGGAERGPTAWIAAAEKILAGSTAAGSTTTGPAQP